MFLFYVLNFFKKGNTIQGGTLFKEIRYSKETCQILKEEQSGGAVDGHLCYVPIVLYVTGKVGRIYTT